MKPSFPSLTLSAILLAAGPAARAAEDQTHVIEGRTFVFRYGNAYEVKNGRERFFKALYDPEFTAKNYRAAGGKVLARNEDGEWLPVRRTFREGFEAAPLLRKLIGERRGWSGFTLQSPLAPKVADYVALRNQIMEGREDFRDNRVEPVRAAARTGEAGLRLYAVPPSETMTTSKASLESGLLYLRQGDDMWFSGWFKIVKGAPVGLLDVESAYIEESPGPRLLLSEDLQPRVELKWGAKPTYRAENKVSFPRGKWFYIRLHLKLYSDPRGRIELWLGPDKIIDAKGQTLPLSDTVLNRLEIGITANGPGGESELYVDDIAFGPTAADAP